MAGRKSLILVTVDCLRADHCGFMGYGRRTTPFLDGLAAHSFVFPNAIVAGVPTYYSFPAILASRYPLALGREVVGLVRHETNLASALKNEGYKTAFFGAGNPYLTPQFGYDFGFDTFRDFVASDTTQNLWEDMPVPSNPRASSRLNHAMAEISHKIPGMRAAYEELYFQYCWRLGSKESRSFDELRRFPAADVIVSEAEDWLASAVDAPFFLWLHFMDPHGPYYPKEDSLELLSEHTLTSSRARYLNASWNRSDIGKGRLRKYRDDIVSMYDAGIRWVDVQLSRLVESLRKSRRWDDCILAFTADHGEEFLDHDGRYHPPSLAEELIHVPLLLRVPGVDKKKYARIPSAYCISPPLYFPPRVQPSLQIFKEPTIGRACSREPRGPVQRLRSALLAVRTRCAGISVVALVNSRSGNRATSLC